MKFLSRKEKKGKVSVDASFSSNTVALPFSKHQTLNSPKVLKARVPSITTILEEQPGTDRYRPDINLSKTSLQSTSSAKVSVSEGIGKADSRIVSPPSSIKDVVVPYRSKESRSDGSVSKVEPSTPQRDNQQYSDPTFEDIEQFSTTADQDQHNSLSNSNTHSYSNDTANNKKLDIGPHYSVEDSVQGPYSTDSMDVQQNKPHSKESDQARSNDNLSNISEDDDADRFSSNNAFTEKTPLPTFSEKDFRVQEKEVIYDINPTLLYKFIEYKEWGEALERCVHAPKEASTWIVRYERDEDDDNCSTCTEYEEDEDYSVRWRMLPIHAAIIFNAPMKLIVALYNAYPAGLLCPDDRKQLPIHLCCRTCTNIDITTFLVSKSRDSLTRTDYKGRKPLDILEEYKASDKDNKDAYKKDLKNRSTISSLIENELRRLKNNKTTQQDPVYSDSVQKLNNGKKATTEAEEVDYDTYPTELVKLLEKKKWDDVIERCADAPHEAKTWMIRREMSHGSENADKSVRWRILPIHSAVVLNAPVEVVEAIIDAYPSGLKKGDDRQMLPLHMAFRLGSHPEVAAVLVDGYPSALAKKDTKGNTPLHILKAYRRKYEKDRKEGKKSDKEVDKNRKALIKFYLGSKTYGAEKSNDTANYDSSSSEDDGTAASYSSRDGLLYNDMFSDFKRLTVEGITNLPHVVRDTLACRPANSYDSEDSEYSN